METCLMEQIMAGRDKDVILSFHERLHKIMDERALETVSDALIFLLDSYEECRKYHKTEGEASSVHCNEQQVVASTNPLISEANSTNHSEIVKVTKGQVTRTDDALQHLIDTLDKVKEDISKDTITVDTVKDNNPAVQEDTKEHCDKENDVEQVPDEEELNGPGQSGCSEPDIAHMDIPESSMERNHLVIKGLSKAGNNAANVKKPGYRIDRNNHKRLRNIMNARGLKAISDVLILLLDRYEGPNDEAITQCDPQQEGQGLGQGNVDGHQNGQRIANKPAHGIARDIHSRLNNIMLERGLIAINDVGTFLLDRYEMQSKLSKVAKGKRQQQGNPRPKFRPIIPSHLLQRNKQGHILSMDAPKDQLIQDDEERRVGHVQDGDHALANANEQVPVFIKEEPGTCMNLPNDHQHLNRKAIQNDEGKRVGHVQDDDHAFAQTNGQAPVFIKEEPGTCMSPPKDHLHKLRKAVQTFTDGGLGRVKGNGDVLVQWKNQAPVFIKEEPGTFMNAPKDQILRMALMGDQDDGRRATQGNENTRNEEQLRISQVASEKRPNKDLPVFPSYHEWMKDDVVVQWDTQGQVFIQEENNIQTSTCMNPPSDLLHKKTIANTCVNPLNNQLHRKTVASTCMNPPNDQLHRKTVTSTCMNLPNDQLHRRMLANDGMRTVQDFEKKRKQLVYQTVTGHSKHKHAYSRNILSFPIKSPTKRKYKTQPNVALVNRKDGAKDTKVKGKPRKPYKDRVHVDVNNMNHLPQKIQDQVRAIVEPKQPKKVIKQLKTQKVKVKRIRWQSLPSSLQCKVCSTILPEIKDMRQHLLTEHGNQELPMPKRHHDSDVKEMMMGKVDTPRCLSDFEVSTLSKKVRLCPTCHKHIPEISISSHLLEHASVESVLCELCGAVFKSKYALRCHRKKQHHKTGYTCKECSKTFANYASFYRHNAYYHSSKGTMFICDKCGKEFKNMKDYQRHMITHMTVKPYQCPDCGKAFSQSNNLRSHQRIHTGEKPYQCDLCPEAFAHNVSLKTHKKKTHGVDMWADNE